MDNSSVSVLSMNINEIDELTRHLKTYRKETTAVFWDVEDCQIPNGSNAVEVSQNIRSALKKMKCCGGATIYSYGNTEQVVKGLEPDSIVVNHIPAGKEYDATDPKYMEYSGTSSIYANETELSRKSPEIVVNHSPEGDKHGRLEKIFVNMFTWAMDNGSPANMMLILGDITEFPMFIGAINRLTMKNYSVLFAQPENKSAPRGFPVSTKCLWEKLSVGEIVFVQTKPVDNTFEGSRRKSPNRLFFLAGALLCFAFARLRLTSSN